MSGQVDVLAVFREILRADVDYFDSDTTRCANEAIGALAKLIEKGRRVQETRDAYRRAGSGKHRDRMAAHVKAIDDFCDALALAGSTK